MSKKQRIEKDPYAKIRREVPPSSYIWKVKTKFLKGRRKDINSKLKELCYTYEEEE